MFTFPNKIAYQLSVKVPFENDLPFCSFTVSDSNCFQIPGGSKVNTMIYGAENFEKDFKQQRRRRENEDNTFLYGSSAMKRYENNNPARRLNHNLLLGDLT